MPRGNVCGITSADPSNNGGGNLLVLKTIITAEHLYAVVGGLRSCYELWGDIPLSDIVHASFN